MGGSRGAGMNDVYGPMADLREVCHDIRQPIAGVLALAGAVLAEGGLSQDARSRLERCESSTRPPPPSAFCGRAT